VFDSREPAVELRVGGLGHALIVASSVNLDQRNR
jgi:hypothetical protein